MRRIGGVLMVLMMTALLAMATGCNSLTQADVNAMSQAAGAAAVGIYSMDNKLTPQQKKAAAAAVVALAAVGKSANEGNIGSIKDLVDQELAKQVKDPEQLALARTVAGTFLGIAQPYIDRGMSTYGSNGAVQAFLSFCKGVASVPIKVAERRWYTLYIWPTS
jgi:hypothetical protein